MKWRTAVPAIVLGATVALPGAAAQTLAGKAGDAGHDSKVAGIRRLVHIMSGRQMKDMMDKMIQSSFRAIEAQMPPDARQDPEAQQVVREFMASASLSEKDLEEMMDLMVPYYDKHLDDADVAALVRFYESPEGRKFVRVMPEMMVEMMPALMSWQMEKLKGPAEKLQNRLREIEERKKDRKAGDGPQG